MASRAFGPGTGGGYADLLGMFPKYARQGVRAREAGGRRYTVFGAAENGENGLRTLGSFVFTACLVYARGLNDPSRTGVGGDELRAWTLSSLDYMTDAHVTGGGACADGGKWGRAWQSAWWATKMAMGAQLVWGELSEAQRAGVERVVAAEADRFVGVPARTGLFFDTKAEENAWDTEILAAALALFPNHANAERWRATLIDYAMNSLSAPQDLGSDQIVDGRPVRERVYTVNAHSDFTIENHGPYHFCYMASPLQSLAFGYAALRLAGQPVSEAQLHHFDDVYRRLRSTFLDNRFAYVAGQDWARYTYGLYFIVPALALVSRLRGDAAARALELKRVERLAMEQRQNGDGSFFGGRVTHGRMHGQWAKYETDCYASIGLAYLLDELLPAPPAPLDDAALNEALRDRHSSPEAGFCYSRSSGLFASFSWASMGDAGPMALFAPRGADDAVEWGAGNLLAVVKDGADPAQTLIQRRMRLTADGFRVDGRIIYRDARGFRMEHDLMLELLESEGVLVIENHVRARRDVTVAGGCGLRYWLPNDVFNAGRRVLFTDAGEVELRFDGEAPPDPVWRVKLDKLARRLGHRPEDRLVVAGRWLNIDDLIGIVPVDGQGVFSVARSGRRNAPWESLHVERIEHGAFGRRRVNRGQTVVAGRYLVVRGDRVHTAVLAADPSRFAAIRLRNPTEAR